MHVWNKPQHLLPKQTASSFWYVLLNKWHLSAIRLQLPKSKPQDQVLHLFHPCRHVFSIPPPHISQIWPLSPSPWHCLSSGNHPSLLDSSSGSPTSCSHKSEHAESLQPVMQFTPLLLITLACLPTAHRVQPNQLTNLACLSSPDPPTSLWWWILCVNLAKLWCPTVWSTRCCYESTCGYN